VDAAARGGASNHLNLVLLPFSGCSVSNWRIASLAPLMERTTGTLE
jgi:hypothetical protein